MSRQRVVVKAERAIMPKKKKKSWCSSGSICNMIFWCIFKKVKIVFGINIQTNAVAVALMNHCDMLSCCKTRANTLVASAACKKQTVTAPVYRMPMKTAWCGGNVASGIICHCCSGIQQYQTQLQNIFNPSCSTTRVGILQQSRAVLYSSRHGNTRNNEKDRRQRWQLLQHVMAVFSRSRQNIKPQYMNSWGTLLCKTLMSKAASNTRQMPGQYY